MAQSLSRKIKVKPKRTAFKRKGNNNCASKLIREKLYEYIRNEYKDSTIHGLPYVVNEKLQRLERTFWFVCLLACSILTFYLLAAQFQRFIETPTVVSVEMDYFNWNVSYPAFTLCPDYKYKIDPEQLSEIVKNYKTTTDKYTESYIWGILTANMDALEFIEFRDLKIIDPRSYSSLAASYFRRFDNQTLTTNNNWPITVHAAMTELGMCHVINSNVAVFDDALKWSNSVKNTTYAKNNIELSVHDRDFFAQIMNYAEIYKVFIHSPDETILSSSSSYLQTRKGFMSYGVQVWTTRISDELRKTSIRLRRCRFVNEPISERYEIYSYNHCLLECRIQMIIVMCGCVPHFYKPLANERVCNLAELQCVLNHKRDILSLSASEMTLIKFRFNKNLPLSYHDCNCLSQCEIDIYQKDFESFIPQDNLERLRIGISTFPRIRVIRDIIFSIQDIVLKIGGVWNLCIGASVLSAIEFCLPLLKLIFISLKKTLRRRTNDNELKRQVKNFSE